MLRVRRNIRRTIPGDTTRKDFWSPGIVVGQYRRNSAATLTGLFGAAYQLDMGLRGLHQTSIGGEIVERHAPRREPRLELLSDRGSV
jgi:hypothetical protein